MTKIKPQLSVEDKYKLYEKSVQCPEADVEFLNEEFENLTGRKAKTLREDFGGTGLLSCLWTKQSPEHSAWAIDLDQEPINYGKGKHYSKLTETDQKRMQYILGNVLDDYDFKADITVAFNFSYYIFKKRNELLNYFKKVRQGVKDDGVFLLDIFGGSNSYEPLVEETEHDKHSYYWDLEKFNPLTNEVLYYIHFKKKGKKYKRVFTYDWRMWSVQEIREILEDAGFSKVVTYWEGDGDDGEGDGKFYQSTDEENCESWVTYIAAQP